MPWIAGVDSVKSQWRVVLPNVETNELRARICLNFSSLLTLDEESSVVTVDIPIGLPEVTRPGGQLCEQQVGRSAGGRPSSVFSAVGRADVRASTRAEADWFNRDAGGIGIDAANLILDDDLAISSPEIMQLMVECIANSLFAGKG